MKGLNMKKISKLEGKHMLLTIDIEEKDLIFAVSGDESGSMHLAESVLEAIRNQYPEIYKQYFED